MQSSAVSTDLTSQTPNSYALWAVLIWGDTACMLQSAEQDEPGYARAHLSGLKGAIVQMCPALQSQAAAQLCWRHLLCE